MRPRDPGTNRRAGAGRSAEIALLVGLLLLLAGEAAVYVGLHRTTSECEEILEVGSPEARAAAVNVLANRPGGRAVDAEMIRRLLDSGEPLLRELTVTDTVTRGGDLRLQRAYLEGLPEGGEKVRAGFFMRFQADTGERMTRGALEKYLESRPAAEGGKTGGEDHGRE